MSMFYRVSTAVISPALVRDLGFTNAQLSDLAAVFFYAFAFSQIPIGIALDRLGSRITMFFLSIAAVGGAVLFALGETPGHLILARALLGIGMSGNLMVVYALLAVWFPLDKFAFLGGVLVSIGVVGNLLAATPLTLLTMSIGWRTSFVIFAVVNALVVATFLLVVRDRPESSASVGLQTGSAIAGLGRLFGMYSYWAISVSQFVRYGYFAALQSLWAAPFLIYGLGFSEISSSNAIFALGLGYMISLPLSGWLSDSLLQSRKNVVLATMFGLWLFTGSVIWWTQTVPVWLVMVTFFGIGVMAAPGQIMYAHIKELLEPSMVAQAMTAVNLFTVLGAGVMTHVLGFVIGSEPSELAQASDFSPVWYVGVVTIGLACLMYCFVPESPAFASSVVEKNPDRL
jgi:MFS family permease